MSLTKTKGAATNTWSLQDTLPRLPVPELDHSCSRLFQSLKLHCETPEELEELKRDLDEFKQNEGRELQSKLLEHDKLVGQKNPPESWIDKWWLNYAYLAYREPLPVNLSVHLVITTHYEITRETRASFLVVTTLKYKDQLDAGAIRPQTVPRLGNVPLCMDQFRRFFCVARVPQEGMDQLLIFPQSRHLVVIRNDHFYRINAYPNGSHITEPDLKAQFEWIVSETERLGPGIPVGILTAQNRDHWAQLRKKLQDQSSTNRETLEIIESAIMVVSLTDDYPTDTTETGLVTMHGRNGRNRWFDKSINLCFYRNGKVGIIGEHTPFEATQPMQLFDWILKREAQHSYRNLGPQTPTSPSEKPKKLNWELFDEVLPSIDQGLKDLQTLVEKVDLRLFKFEEFGNQWIKKICHVSPDSFVQMALQLTYFRLHKKTPPTYESASARQFLNGRTETGRPVSSASIELCKAFDSKELPLENKLQLFRDASAHHVDYMMDCFNGKGWDRHLFGLRILAAQGGSSEIKLFANKVFQRGNRFLLSTSNISPGTMFCGGFGIVDPEGYGVCYLIESSYIWFNVSSSHECPQTSSTRFEVTLIQTLLDLKDAFQRAHHL